MSEAAIRWISGPVLRAGSGGGNPFHVHEALLVGPRSLLGEVIRVSGDELVAQVYEDTTGLRPGDPVRGSGGPLSVRLGPALLGRIFDGLLRPLDYEGGDYYVTPGWQEGAVQRCDFRPLVARGDTVAAGAAFGEVHGGGRVQRCLVPPGRGGRVADIAAAGPRAEDETVCTLHGADDAEIALAMSQSWPVRRARPIAERLPPSQPLVTGQRILDTLFPLARGGRAGLPGGFGTGKTVLQQALAKWCDADVIVYVGCGERGNEMAEVLHQFPELEDPRTGRPLMERTVIIANTSNMAVAAREASIYTAITVAEYFRDQGLHVALMADSTSRWAEALREFSGRLGELPGEAGYPAYLNSRLAEFYERAARVRTLGGEEGSVSIIGAVSPPAGDFSEPVTSHTKRYVHCFWGLDRDRAQARFYPAIHPLQSYSENVEALAPWWREQGDAEWSAHRRRLLTLLEQQARLERMARIVGKDALPPNQQLVLLCADLANEGFLRQSAFSVADRYCSPRRQAAMLQLVVRFAELAERALAQDVAVDHIAALPVLRRLQRMGEELGEEDAEALEGLWHELDEAFAGLAAEAGHGP